MAAKRPPTKRLAKKPAKAGRKPIEIDLAELEKLGQLHATDEEIAAWFGTTTRTIERRRKESRKFREALDKGKARGKISLRRLQVQSAQNGNIAAQIWLGKQILNQREPRNNDNIEPTPNQQEKPFVPQWLERDLKETAARARKASPQQGEPEDFARDTPETLRSKFAADAGKVQ
jgi:hypothetical protein